MSKEVFRMALEKLIADLDLDSDRLAGIYVVGLERVPGDEKNVRVGVASIIDSGASDLWVLHEAIEELERRYLARLKAQHAKAKG